MVWVPPRFKTKLWRAPPNDPIIERAPTGLAPPCFHSFFKVGYVGDALVSNKVFFCVCVCVCFGLTAWRKLYIIVHRFVCLSLVGIMASLMRFATSFYLLLYKSKDSSSHDRIWVIPLSRFTYVYGYVFSLAMCRWQSGSVVACQTHKRDFDVSTPGEGGIFFLFRGSVFPSA